MIIVKHLGLQAYEKTWQEMKDFTFSRDKNTLDECWILEHPPVYTQGVAGKQEHVLNPGSIPIVQSDRGGQVTYHGPGQLLAYFLLDLNRRSLGVRILVQTLERLLIQLLADYGIKAQCHCGAPGVYVEGKKIASLGLRVRHACSYHGLALNVAMDLNPFLGINPCGFAKLEMVQIQDFIPDISLSTVEHKLTTMILRYFEN